MKISLSELLCYNQFEHYQPPHPDLARGGFIRTQQPPGSATNAPLCSTIVVIIVVLVVVVRAAAATLVLLLHYIDILHVCFCLQGRLQYLVKWKGWSDKFVSHYMSI